MPRVRCALVLLALACQPVPREPPPAASLTPPATPVAGPTPPGMLSGRPLLVPDVGFGPFALGMTIPEFDAAASAAGLPVSHGFFHTSAGPYVASFTDPDQRLSTIVAHFNVTGAAFGDRAYGMEEFEDLHRKLQCTRIPGSEGGDVHICANRVLLEVSHGKLGFRVMSRGFQALYHEYSPPPL